MYIPLGNSWWKSLVEKALAFFFFPLKVKKKNVEYWNTVWKQQKCRKVKKVHIVLFSEVPSQLYLENQKCETLQIHAVKAVHTILGPTMLLWRKKLRIVGVLHNIYIERIMCAYKDSICFLLCTQVLQWKMSRHWITEFY